eukprot:7689110-Heterocapsa_arctica.AAC.1
MGGSKAPSVPSAGTGRSRPPKENAGGSRPGGREVAGARGLTEGAGRFPLRELRQMAVCTPSGLGPELRPLPRPLGSGRPLPAATC